MAKKTTLLKLGFVILLLLIAARVALPYALLHYVEYRLNQIPDYQAHVGDIHVRLWRGSYEIKDIQLQKLHKQIPVPFFAAESVELQIEWQALLRGALVGQIRMEQPKLNFVTDPRGKNEQLTIDQQWRQAVNALFPLNFNRIILHNGQVHYRSYAGEPPFNIYLKSVNAEVDNLRKVTQDDKEFSSKIHATAEGMDGSPVTLNVRLDPFAKQPTFKLNASLGNMAIPTANDFLHHYTKLDIKQGYFSLYLEAAAAKGKIIGYAKPMIKDLQVLDPNEQNNPVKALYKGAVQAVAKILENPEQGTVATKIPIKGDIKNPDTSVWSTIINLLHHGFIEALLPQIDHSIKMKDIELNN